MSAISFHPGGPVLALVLLAVIGLALTDRAQRNRLPPIRAATLHRALRLAFVAFAVFGTVRLGVNVAAF